MVSISASLLERKQRDSLLCRVAQERETRLRLKREKEEDKGKQFSEGGKVTVGMFATGATEKKKSPETDKEALGTEDGVDGAKMDGKDKDSDPQDRPAVGPHDEAGEEAERVAEELFGDYEDE